MLVFAGRAWLMDEPRRLPTLRRALCKIGAAVLERHRARSERVLRRVALIGEAMSGAQQREHEPVLVTQVQRLLCPKPGDVFVDGTVGLGGHAEALIPSITPGGVYIGLDIDAALLPSARERLGVIDGVRLHLEHASYVDLPDVLARLGVAQVDHILLDVGVNSAQLSDAARGFSFERDGPLDMRFDREQKLQAVDLVNGLSESELADLFYEFGQEQHSRKIAKRICHVRHSSRITTTRSLATAVAALFGPAGLAASGKIHPATRVFQALRVAVNSELENLTRALPVAEKSLKPGGKLAVICFHSLEDGIVKRYLREAKAAGTMVELTRRPEIADAQEREQNPRSRSAKLRVGQKVSA